MHCPYCHNEIKEIESCPICEEPMIFKPGEGPFGTWECSVCSEGKYIVGFRANYYGLVRVNDSVGRYKHPEVGTLKEAQKNIAKKIQRLANEARP